MAQINASTSSPTYEDSPVNRLKEFISYGIIEFNIRASKELMISKVSEANISYKGVAILSKKKAQDTLET